MLTRPAIGMFPRFAWTSSHVFLAGDSFHFKSMIRRCDTRLHSFTLFPTSYMFYIDGERFSIRDAIFAEKDAPRRFRSGINPSGAVVFIFANDPTTLEELVINIKSYRPFKDHTAHYIVTSEKGVLQTVHFNQIEHRILSDVIKQCLATPDQISVPNDELSLIKSVLGLCRTMPQLNNIDASELVHQQADSSRKIQAP